VALPESMFQMKARCCENPLSIKMAKSPTLLRHFMGDHGESGGNAEGNGGEKCRGQLLPRSTTG
jgi:hypothetical protein